MFLSPSMYNYTYMSEFTLKIWLASESMPTRLMKKHAWSGWHDHRQENMGLNNGKMS